MWVLIRATSLFNLLCSNVARQVACFLWPVFQYLYDQYYHFTTQSFQFKDILESIVPKLSRL